MSISQSQLVKWSLPTFALILGLLWYKRRRVDRVDPGGISKPKGDTELINGSSTPKSSSNSDSGIHTDDSIFNCSTPNSAEEISPRKVSDSLDIPNRKSSSVSMSMLSNTPWYEDEPDTPDTPEIEIQLGSNPCKSGFEFMSKNSSKSTKKSPTIMEEVIQDNTVTKIVVAKSATESIAAEFKISSNNDSNKSLEDQKNQKQVHSDRDSANQSPISGVLEGSVHDEARSEGSTDSGKGGSIHELHPPIRTLYEFAVPLKFVGKLIGKGGRFLQKIKNNTGVYNVIIKHHPSDCEFKVCCIDGTDECIQAALELIRHNFPEKAHPQMTLEPITFNDEMTWSPNLTYLTLAEAVNNDVVISSIVKPNHFFVQLPTHPTYPKLAKLEQKMESNYESADSSLILPPNDLARGMVMVAKLFGKWVRVIVEEPDPNGEATLVRLADHGGYYNISHTDMRKIKFDYLELPFQSIEVFLANIQPKEEWSDEAFSVVHDICRNIVGQAQIEAFFDTHTFISLYFNIPGYGVISLADELIARGLAEPITFEEVVPQEPVPVV